MDPTVEAALIAAAATVVGIGSTAAIAIAGFHNTRTATIAALNAARDERRYDKRADVYVDVLAMMAQQRGRRDTMSEMLDAGFTGPRASLPHIAADWALIEARLQAFAPVETFTLVQTYSDAVIAAEQAWRNRAQPGGVAACTSAIEAANAAATRVIMQVRAEVAAAGTPSDETSTERAATT